MGSSRHARRWPRHLRRMVSNDSSGMVGDAAALRSRRIICLIVFRTPSQSLRRNRLQSRAEGDPSPHPSGDRRFHLHVSWVGLRPPRLGLSASRLNAGWRRLRHCSPRKGSPVGALTFRTGQPSRRYIPRRPCNRSCSYTRWGRTILAPPLMLSRRNCSSAPQVYPPSYWRKQLGHQHCFTKLRRASPVSFC